MSARFSYNCRTKQCRQRSRRTPGLRTDRRLPILILHKLQPNGALVDVSSVARGWSGFYVKVTLDGGAEEGSARACTHESSAGSGTMGKVGVSFAPERYPELFNGSGGCPPGALASGAAGAGRNLDMVVRVRLRPRFVKASVPRTPQQGEQGEAEQGAGALKPQPVLLGAPGTQAAKSEEGEPQLLTLEECMRLPARL